MKKQGGLYKGTDRFVLYLQKNIVIAFIVHFRRINFRNLIPKFITFVADCIVLIFSFFIQLIIMGGCKIMNPCNVLSIMGDVFSDIRPLTQKNTGEIYGVFFQVRVPRAFRNADGTYDYDMLPIQYRTLTDAMQKFALNLKCGDSISIVGTVQVTNGQFMICTDSVSLMMASADRLHKISSDDEYVPAKAETVASNSTQQQQNEDEGEDSCLPKGQCELPF